MWISKNTDFSAFELDELYWFTNRKFPLDKRENIYTITMTSRNPRQIVAFDVDYDKEAKRIQRIVDSVPPADKYFTDGNKTYLDVDFPTYHIPNQHNKNDTHLTESINADLRHYIAGLARKSRTFFRSQETKYAVLAVFIDAYNKYGEAKQKYRVPVTHKSQNPAKHLHKYRDLPFSILDYL